MSAERHPLFYLWLVIAAAAPATMWFFPGQETIPYHLAWIGLALAYDREVWSLRPTIVAVVLFTLITGGVLITRAGEGVVGWQETAEIPLMTLLLALVMWNVWRRRQALAALAQLAERDRRRAAGASGSVDSPPTKCGRRPPSRRATPSCCCNATSSPTSTPTSTS